MDSPVPREPGWRWAPVGLFLLALLPRLSALWQGFVTPDEPMWVFRSFRFAQALAARRWMDTFQIGHPGVLTMWMGALGIWWRQWRDPAGTAAHLAWIDRVAWVTPDNGELFRHLAAFLPAARLAMALLTSLGVVGIYLLAARLWDRRLALAGAALLALDPFAIGLSGLLHVDAPAATCMALSLLAWLNALDAWHARTISPPSTPPGRGWRALPMFAFALCAGMCGGLSVLSKSPGVFIAVPTGLAALLFVVLRPLSWRRVGWVALLGGVWLLGAAAALFTFPAMWVDPEAVMRGVYGLADRQLDTAHRISFFRGVGGGDPGPLFYPAVFLFRLTPATLVGALLSFLPMLGGWRAGRPGGGRPSTGEPHRRRAILVALWALAAGFAAFIAISAKKFDRYLLPAFPAIDLLAAFGWVQAARWLYARRFLPHSRARVRPPMPTRAYAAILGILLAVQAAMILAGWPYYLDVYNPLAGGMGAALRTLPVGWGEGLEQVAGYLNRQAAARAQGAPEADQAPLFVAGASAVTLSPLFDGQVAALDPQSRILADKVLVTATDRQVYSKQVAQLISGGSLEYVVHAGGQEVLWLYDARNEAEPNHLALYGAPGDLIVCDAPSSFARHSTDERVHLLAGADEAEIVERLNGWTASHWRLWYLSYPSVASPITASALRRQLDTYAAELDRVELGYAVATLYILPDQPVFAPLDDAGGTGLSGTARFAGGLRLAGAAVMDAAPPADGRARFLLRWRADGPLPANYSVFVHILDKTGHLRTAGRGQELLVDARGWPTGQWQAGDGIEIDYGVGFPDGLPPGRYEIAIGLTDVATGGWVPALDEQGQMVGTTARVLAVEVGPAERLPSPDALRLEHPLDAAWEGWVVLLGYNYPLRAAVGQTIAVELGWRGLGEMGDDAQVRLALAREGVIAQQATYPLSGYSTSRWRVGELIDELYDLPLSADLAAGSYTLVAEVLDDQGRSLGSQVALGDLDVSSEERLFALPRAPQYPLDLRLGEGIRLLGYDLPAPAAAPGENLAITLYWQCEQRVATSYTVFVHLLDADGQVQGQRDRVQARGRAPTSGWVEGQIVVDAYEIPVAGSAPPGTCLVEVGMYDARDMARLPIRDAQGTPLPGDRALLGTEIEIQ